MSKANRMIKIMVFVAMYAALATALDVVKEMLSFLDMPMGGSINIALIPVVLASFHLGPVLGMATGALWMLVSFVVTPPYFAQNYVALGFICDYVIPSIIVGASSFLFFKGKKNMILMEVGIVITMLIRTVSILLSGAFAWPGDAASGSWAAWLGSINYNVPYCLATMVMLMIVIPLLYQVFKKQFSKTM